jgi:hypothetical protein
MEPMCLSEASGSVLVTQRYGSQDSGPSMNLKSNSLLIR